MSDARVSPDPRPLYARASAQTATLIAAVEPTRLGDPTPCAEFDVRALLEHLVTETDRLSGVGEGLGGSERPGDGDTQSAGVPDDGWAKAYDRSRNRLAAAWAEDAKLDASVPMPWGKVPGRAALAACVMETVTHTWDLAQATGWSGALDEELGEFALGAARQSLPAGRRGGAVPFAAVREAPEGADVYGQLAAWLGREPLDPQVEGVREAKVAGDE